MAENFKRMIQMATEIFDASHDPMQLNVNEEVIAKLLLLHPASVSEKIDGDGPIVWILILPTTAALMHEFIEGKISETVLLDQTPVNIKYESIYLCSAMVLEEFRNKGLAKKITLDAIKKIRVDHPIQSLFVWPFTEEGNALARVVAEEEKLPLYRRKSPQS